MAPETERLIGIIEDERTRARQLADDTDREIKESDEAFQEVSREISETTGETEEAVKTLRRAGLLASA